MLLNLYKHGFLKNQVSLMSTLCGVGAISVFFLKFFFVCFHIFLLFCLTSVCWVGCSLHHEKGKVGWRKVLKSIIRLFIPAALFLSRGGKILFQIINKVRIIFAPPVLLKQSVHLALLTSQILISQFVQVFIRVDAERGQSVVQAQTLHMISQDDVKPLQLAQGYVFQVVPVPRMVLQPFCCQAVAGIFREVSHRHNSFSQLFGFLVLVHQNYGWRTELHSTSLCLETHLFISATNLIPSGFLL